MTTDYRLDLHTAAGVKTAEVTDFLNLAYSRQVNAPGLLSFSLDGNHAALADLENNSQAIVYRRNAAMNLDWTADFWGLYRAQTRQFTDHDVFTASCPGLLTMLGWRIIAWNAGTTNKSDFSAKAAETVLKDLVTFNATSSATVANGRIRAGAITGVSVETDGAHGNTISLGCSWKNLLETLQTIASIAGGDFDLVKTTTGGQTFEFRWYTGQRGTDRTTTVLFALDRGNMSDPEYDFDRTKEQTVAIVGGAGEEDNRTVEIRTGDDYVATTNDEEVFVDARSDKTTAALDAKGDAKLFDVRAREKFSFKVLQTPSAFYGVHYFLGDLVAATYRAITTTQKIIGVAVSLDASGAEKIDVTTATQ